MGGQAERASEIIQPGVRGKMSGVYEESGVVEELWGVRGIEDEVDEQARIAVALAMGARLQCAEGAGFQLYPIRALRGGGADADEDIALGDGLLDVARKILSGAQLLCVEPVVHAPGGERGQERRAGVVVLVGVADEDVSVARHVVRSAPAHLNAPARPRLCVRSAA